jgi:hypothetical protein
VCASRRALKVVVMEMTAAVKYMLSHCSADCSFFGDDGVGCEVHLLFSHAEIASTCPR